MSNIFKMRIGYESIARDIMQDIWEKIEDKVTPGADVDITHYIHSVLPESVVGWYTQMFKLQIEQRLIKHNCSIDELSQLYTLSAEVQDNKHYFHIHLETEAVTAIYAQRKEIEKLARFCFYALKQALPLPTTTNRYLVPCGFFNETIINSLVRVLIAQGFNVQTTEHDTYLEFTMSEEERVEFIKFVGEDQ